MPNTMTRRAVLAGTATAALLASADTAYLDHELAALTLSRSQTHV